MTGITFEPTAMCEFCELEIMLCDGYWVDRTITEPCVDPSFAAACGEGSEFHKPWDEA